MRRGSAIVRIRPKLNMRVKSIRLSQLVTDLKSMCSAAIGAQDRRACRCFGPMPYHFQLIDPDRKSDAGASQTGIQSPMPGLVKQVAVQAGQNVQEGDALLMLKP